MLPSELIMLIATVISSDSGLSFFSSPLGEMDRYLESLYSSLVKRGYLVKDSGKYNLTPKGAIIFTSFLDDNRAKARSIVSTLERVREEGTQKFDEIFDEVVKAA